MKGLLLFFICGLFSLFGCNSESNKIADKIIVVFQPDSGALYLGQNLGITVNYVDDFLIPHEFRPGEFGQNRYVIPTAKKYLDISCQYKNALKRHFLFQNGDSVVIKLGEIWPVAEILNRNVNFNESNFERKRQHHLFDDENSSLEDFYYYWHEINNPINPINGSIISEELEYLKEKALNELDTELNYIDSLSSNQIISEAAAEFYRSKSGFEKKKLSLYNDSILSFDNKVVFESIVSDINEISNDSLLAKRFYTFYDDFVSAYFRGSVDSELGKIVDLDSLIELDFYSDGFGRSLLWKITDKMLHSLTIAEARKILEPFVNDPMLKNWSDFFHAKYNLDQDFNVDWRITDDQNQIFRFKDILLYNQGKLLYIDFWASWCQESIHEMPALEEIYNEHKSSGFDVVYISVDKEEEKWKWANSQYLSYNRPNSYLLDPSDLLVIRESFNMNTLPRYMLFDQEGKLLHGNAPKPESKALRLLINRHLNNGAESH
jgi:thiol-disulfide isomerase/thioredoxin